MWKIVSRMLIGAVVGAGIAFGFIKLALSMHVNVKGIGWADALALWLGISFLGAGLGFFGMSFSRREVAESLEGYSAKLPATDEEIRTFRLQAAVTMLAGAMLLSVYLVQGTLHGVSTSAGWWAFAGLVVLFGLQTAANVALWRICDEFLRRQILITGALTFAIVQGALFLWAAAERLHLVRAASSWDTITLVLLVYMVVASCMAIRNRPASMSTAA
jgi:hypothetical protein